MSKQWHDGMNGSLTDMSLPKFSEIDMSATLIVFVGLVIMLTVWGLAYLLMIILANF